MLQQHISHFMEELAIDKGVLSSDSSGSYTLRLDGGIAITIGDLPSGGCTLKATIAPFPKGKEETCTTQLLLANLFGQGTRGAILGLSEDATQVVMSRALDYPIAYKEFKDAIEDFIGMIDFWFKELPLYAT